LLKLKNNLATYHQKPSTLSLSFHVNIYRLRLGLQDVHPTQIWVMLKKV